jgi:antirepressor protein/GIY-YIG catalytic domain-containing protein
METSIMRLTPRQRALLAEQTKSLPATLPEDTFAIYTLTDPTSNAIHYVGMTQQSPRVRLMQHLKHLTTRGMKQEWLTRLMDDEQVPIMTIVEMVTGTQEDALERERHWINRLQGEGHPLLNAEVLPRRKRMTDREREDWLEEQDRTVFIPAQQETINFLGRSLIAVRLTDGRIAAALRTMCDALQLDRPGQLRRIREDEILADQLVPVRVETDGGPQVMEMLTAWAIPTWLTGIQIKRVAADKREAILAFRREAADALYRHFSHSQIALLAPTPLVPSEPITKPSVPPQDAPPDVWLQYHQQMITFIQWQGDVECWRGAVESRLESVEEVTRLVPEILERLGPQTLTPEHQATIKHQAARLHELSGRAYATIYGDLNTAFHVARYGDIADARWPEIAAWFKTRLDAAEQRHSGHRA